MPDDALRAPYSLVKRHPERERETMDLKDSHGTINRRITRGLAASTGINTVGCSSASWRGRDRFHWFNNCKQDVCAHGRTHACMLPRLDTKTNTQTYTHTHSHFLSE